MTASGPDTVLREFALPAAFVVADDATLQRLPVSWLPTQCRQCSPATRARS